MCVVCGNAFKTATEAKNCDHKKPTKKAPAKKTAKTEASKEA